MPHARFVSMGCSSPMPEPLTRIYGLHHLHFITFSCYQRRPLLESAESRNVLVYGLDQVRHEYNFKLVGYVVMPEHVHLLISEPNRCDPSTVLKMLKQRTSHQLRHKFGIVTDRRRFGSIVSTTSTFGVARRKPRNSHICMRIRSSGIWLKIRKTGRGAVTLSIRAGGMF